MNMSEDRISNLRHADSTDLLAENFDSMCNVLNKVNAAREKSCLKVNSKTTKVMYVNRKTPPDHISVDPHLYSFFPNTIRLWNNLPQHIKACETLASLNENLKLQTLRDAYW